MSDALCWNGVDARTGQPLLAPMEPAIVSELALGQPLESPPRRGSNEPHLGVRDGVDPTDLAQAGWGLILPHGDPKEQRPILDALEPLIALRRAQAARDDERRFRILAGADGLRPGEGKAGLLRRVGAAPGAVDPTKLPYYLLLVGSPAEIPWSVQHHLDVQHAVGRLDFDAPAELGLYARAVVAAEARGAGRRSAAFFGVENDGDLSTRLSAKHLVTPLAEALRARPEAAGWNVETLVGPAATRAALAERLGGAATPGLLFAACHGVGFPAGDPLQRDHQGGLLCQDWPGPATWGPRPLDRGHWLAGEDVVGALPGTVAFLFACFGAGTPARDSFPHRRGEPPPVLAPSPFVSRLAQRLLTAPGGGALAVVAHVDRAFGWSFLWPDDSPGGPKAHRGPFEDALARLLAGHPVGDALEPFHQRWAELTTDLVGWIEDVGNGATADERAVAALWTASNDARGYAIIGDPACRLRPSDGAAAGTRPDEAGDPGSLEPTGGGTAVRVGTHADGVPAPPVTRAPLPRDTRPPEPATPPEPTAPPREDAGGVFDALRDALAALGRGLTEASRLEVRTWVAGAPDPDDPVGGAALRAYTRTAVDGDTDTVVAAGAGPDDPVLALHARLVGHAQTHRAQLLETLASLLRSLGA